MPRVARASQTLHMRATIFELRQVLRLIPRRAAWLFAPLCLAAGACQSYKSQPPGWSFRKVPAGLVLSTDPPGARIIADDADTGFATPCNIHLEEDEWHKLAFELPGYETAVRVLAPDGRMFAVYWSDFAKPSQEWRFPLWTDLGDLLTPLKFSSVLSPGRIHVTLVPVEAEPLAGGLGGAGGALDPAPAEGQ